MARLDQPAADGAGVKGSIRSSKGDSGADAPDLAPCMAYVLEAMKNFKAEQAALVEAQLGEQSAQVQLVEAQLQEQAEQAQMLEAQLEELRVENARLKGEQADFMAEQADFRAEQAHFNAKLNDMRQIVQPLAAGGPDTKQPSLRRLETTFDLSKGKCAVGGKFLCERVKILEVEATKGHARLTQTVDGLHSLSQRVNTLEASATLQPAADVSRSLSLISGRVDVLETRASALEMNVSSLGTRVRTLETHRTDEEASSMNQTTADHTGLTQRVKALEALDLPIILTKVEDLDAKLACVSGDSTNVTLNISGCDLVVQEGNLVVRDGQGPPDYSNEYHNLVLPTFPEPNGKGNIIIGYNTPQTTRSDRNLANTNHPAIETERRVGSHNLVIGEAHSFTGRYGIVAGFDSHIGGVSGEGDYAVALGFGNSATGFASAVLGGVDNSATGEASAVMGGGSNTASGYESAVAGGRENFAHGTGSAVAGGQENSAHGTGSAVVGGNDNTADGIASAAMGGIMNSADADYSAVVGGEGGQIAGMRAVLLGGYENNRTSNANEDEDKVVLTELVEVPVATSVHS